MINSDIKMINYDQLKLIKKFNFNLKCINCELK